VCSLSTQYVISVCRNFVQTQRGHNVCRNATAYIFDIFKCMYFDCFAMVYSRLPSDQSRQLTDVTLRFRTNHSDGILFWAGLGRRQTNEQQATHTVDDDDHNGFLGDNSTGARMWIELNGGLVGVGISDWSNSSKSPGPTVEMQRKGHRVDDNMWHTVAFRRLDLHRLDLHD
jgi:hypothetical protein